MSRLNPSDGKRGRSRRLSAFVLVVSAAILLSGCWVNQNGIWSSDKLSTSSPVSHVPTLANLSYGPDSQQRLDLHLPSAPIRGIIVWFHAGGWCCGDKTEIDRLVLSTLGNGYAIASVDYRLIPQISAEQQMADVDRAIRFVKAQRNSWGAGTGKLIVAGGSAGGNLALLAAAAPGVFAGPGLGPLASVDPRVDAVISLVGPSDLRPYVDGEVGGWGAGLVEGYLGCSNLGSQWPVPTTSSTVAPPTSSSSSTSITAVTPTTPPPSTPMPLCDPARVLRFSPLFWAVLTVFFGGHHLPPAYLAYGDQDTLVPPSSQGVVLHDWWAQGGNWLATYYDNPRTGTHNLSFDVNASAFNLWLRAFGSP